MDLDIVTLYTSDMLHIVINKSKCELTAKLDQWTAFKKVVHCVTVALINYDMEDRFTCRQRSDFK